MISPGVSFLRKKIVLNQTIGQEPHWVQLRTVSCGPRWRPSYLPRHYNLNTCTWQWITGVVHCPRFAGRKRYGSSFVRFGLIGWLTTFIALSAISRVGLDFFRADVGAIVVIIDVLVPPPKESLNRQVSVLDSLNQNIFKTTRLIQVHLIPEIFTFSQRRDGIFECQ